MTESGIEAINTMGKSQTVLWSQIENIKKEPSYFFLISYIRLIDDKGKRLTDIPYPVSSINTFIKKVDEFAGKGNPLREYLFRYVD